MLGNGIQVVVVTVLAAFSPGTARSGTSPEATVVRCRRAGERGCVAILPPHTPSCTQMNQCAMRAIENGGSAWLRCSCRRGQADHCTAALCLKFKGIQRRTAPVVRVPLIRPSRVLEGTPTTARAGLGPDGSGVDDAPIIGTPPNGTRQCQR